ncbi:hypothetical protein N2152v2_002238 [Parachlorella kessleri]
MKAQLLGTGFNCSPRFAYRRQRLGQHLRWRAAARRQQPARAVEDWATTAELVKSQERQEQQQAVAVEQHGKRVAVLQATKFAALPVEEAGRPLAEYMTLPASQYSVLDAKKIERLDEETFVCHVGGLKFFNFEVEPVITVSVTVLERGPTVRLLSCKLRGSKMVEQANDKFSATMTNVVQWREAQQPPSSSNGSSSASSSHGGAAAAAAVAKEICSDTSIQVVLEVPGWFVIPTGIIEKTGCRVMETVLNTAVPRFLQQLSVDYQVWAAGGDESTRHSMAQESSVLAFVEEQGEEQPESAGAETSQGAGN